MLTMAEFAAQQNKLNIAAKAIAGYSAFLARLLKTTIYDPMLLQNKTVQVPEVGPADPEILGS